MHLQKARDIMLISTLQGVVKRKGKEKKGKDL